MTQREQKQSAEFKAKWMLVYSEFKGNGYDIEIFVSRNNPYAFCRPSCGDWDAWQINPETGWRENSCICTFEHLMNNY